MIERLVIVASDPPPNRQGVTPAVKGKK